VSDLWIALVFFLCLVGASVLSLFTHTRLPTWHNAAETREVVRLCASIFVVMTSLVLGLMVNSAKNTFETADKNVHSYATELILLDRTLRQYGPDTESVRRQLLTYVKQAAARMAQSDPVLGSRTAERLLDDVAEGLRALQPGGADQLVLRTSAEHRFATIFEMRWALVEQSEGTIPTPLVVLLGAWLALIFASFGYCAPRNAVVGASLVISSLLIASAIYLILDMDRPFDGTIQISAAPLNRAIAEIQH
jgi:hypothetical protein